MATAKEPTASGSAALPRARGAPRRQGESTGVVVVAGTGREVPIPDPVPPRAARMAPSADPSPGAHGIAVLATLVALAALVVGYLVFRR